ncbi:MAG TPA: Tex family protein [Dehalococcoidia bacterium]|nr:Tex family protein [Dehalococcoidia bacterium]
MLQTHVEKISGELRVAARRIAAAANLLDGGATVPFIARYRKEATDSLDEVEVTQVRDRLEQLRDLDQRREAILASLEERELLTPELAARINAAQTMAVLEDIYLPYRPKRRTRATIAREKGLEPLAEILWRQDETDPPRAAAGYVDPAKGVETAGDALTGARDIMAEWVSEDTTARATMRQRFLTRGIIVSKVTDGPPDQAIKYRDYYDWREPVAAVTSHRLLAMLRGERESMLTVRVQPEEEEALLGLEARFVKGDGPSSQQMRLAVHDGYKRLLSPSMETETRKVIKQRADETAIQVFASNLRQLLLAPPLGEKNVLALDPGFRTGCKLVCLDRQGKLLHRETIYPLLAQQRAEQAGQTVKDLCRRFEIEAIAVGNGTGGRETEAFLRTIELGPQIPVVMVNESGASIYSASEVARAEFPDEDLTVRGAVSIGRRLMAPLAELVKIDPKSIGVGQYQHDVDQKALRGRLDDVAVGCVNRVGVAVNTASMQLLAYVSGLGPGLAQAIVKYRDENGPFKSRETLKKVPRLGPKAFEQAAGFLRIREGEHPLDASAVHPESYHIVEAMSRDANCSVESLLRDASLREKIDPKKYVSEEVGMPTLADIMDELARPGRDPRQEFAPFSFDQGVQRIEDLTPGMRLPGIVTNITAFGAFVDVGVHQDGLIHISQLADRFVRDPSEIVQLQQPVDVTVLEVDLGRKRISLSLKASPGR